MPMRIRDKPFSSAAWEKLAYVRLTGNHDADIDYRTVTIDRGNDLARWAEQVMKFAELRRARGGDVYVLLNNHYAGFSAESVREFYAELPITIKITGSYHDMGAFASDIGKLSRIVTLNDMALAPTKSGLVMDATARTYRYLDEEEASKRRKAAVQGKAKAAPAKK